MAKEALNLEDLRQKGLNHLAELLESKKEDEDDEPKLGDEDDKKEDDKKEDDVKESHFDKAVEGVELNEADVEKMKAAFEAAVQERLDEALASVNATVEAKLQEAKDAEETKITNYLDFVVEGWMKENQVEVERAVKVELAESFLVKLKALFEEHSLVLESDEKIDAIQEAQAETEAAKEELAEALARLAEEKQVSFALRVKGVVDSLCEGMIDTQKERFVKMVDDVDVEITESIDAVRERLQNIKDAITKDISESEDDDSKEVFIEEEVKEVEVKEEKIDKSAKAPELDPKMASYVKAVKRSFSALNR